MDEALRQQNLSPSVREDVLVLSFWGIGGKRFFCKATPA